MSANGDEKIGRAVDESMKRRPIEIFTIILLPDNNIHVSAPLNNIPLCINMLQGAMGLIRKVASEQSRITVPKLILPN